MTKDIVIGVFVAEFAGDFPALDTPSDIDLSELERGGEKPFFVTLPIIPNIGVVSANGLLYDDELATSIEGQINAKRPGANFGHLSSEDRATAFPHPKAFWVAAKRVGETLWAKAYVPVGEARQHLRNLMVMNGRIATSIFGRGDFEEVRKGVRRLTDFNLETVDFAPPERAALGYSAPVIITAELRAAGGPDNTQEATMPEKNMSEFIQELRAVDVPPQKGWTLPVAAVEEVSELADIRQTLGADETADLRQLVSELLQEREEAKKATVKARISELVSEGIKLADARDIVTEYIEARHPKTVQEADAAYAQVIEMPSVKKVLALTVQSLSGPAAIVNGKVRETGRPTLEDTPENRARAAAAMGINI